MDEVNQLAIDVGAALRDVGIARTMEAEGETWMLRALDELRRFSSDPSWSEFKTEDFRVWLAGFLPPPHSSNVWGALTRRACLEGIIRWTGKYAPSVSPKTHAHPVKVWATATPRSLP